MHRRFLPAVLLAAGCLFAQAPDVQPPFRGSLPTSPAVLSSVFVPFETPASIACVYGLAPTLVPGCPVVGTSALPSGGSGMIVIVSAYDYPTAQDDLNVFSRQFGVPECNEANPCFSKVYAAGNQPMMDPLWAASDAGIIQYAHAFAPAAKIVLIEATTASYSNTNAAIFFANRYVTDQSPTGAQMIIAFGSLERRAELATDWLFTTPGIVYISGNQLGIDLEYPAASPNVIGVGVTGFIRNAEGNFVLETASTYDAGGSSAWEPRPPYQDSIQDIVGARRGVPDVALVADPLYGAVILYDSIELNGFVGWQFTGNVGIAEAIWAAIINRAGRHRPSTAAELAVFYSHLGDRRVFRDIVFGQAFGKSAGPGWDVLTGLGVDAGLLGK